MVRIFVQFFFFFARENGSLYLSRSSCGGFRSAYKQLFCQCKMPSNSAWEDDLLTKYKGIASLYAQGKSRSGGRIAEGKDPMSFTLFDGSIIQ